MRSSSDLRLHEEMFLLCLHDAKGTLRASNWRLAVAGALLAELLLEGRVEIRPGARPSKDRVLPGDSRLLAEPLLDECLRRVREAKKPTAPKDWVTKFSQVRSLRHRVATGLAQRGILRPRQARILLLVPWTFYPQLDPAPKRRVLERIRTAILEDGAVDERTGALVAIAAKTGALKPVLDRRSLKQRKARIEDIATSQLAASAVQGAVEAARAATAAAVTAGS